MQGQQLNPHVTLQIQNLNRKNSQFGVYGKTVISTNDNQQNIDLYGQGNLRSGTGFFIKKKDMKTI